MDKTLAGDGWLVQKTGGADRIELEPSDKGITLNENNYHFNTNSKPREQCPAAKPLEQP